VLFGRAEEDSPIILDLSPDQRVSRLHGRIWEEQGVYWIEDLNSSRGTQVNGVDIKGNGKKQLQPGDSIIAGQTTLKVDFTESPGIAHTTNYLERGTCLLREKHHTQSGVAIAKDIDGTAVETVAPASPEDSSTRRFKMVWELPFLLATKTSLETLLPVIVDRLAEVIPAAESWALVLREPKTDILLLKAYRSVERTYLSETLLRRAITDRKAFIWKKEAGPEAPGNPAPSGMETGMYAPLLWQGEALGAIYAGARNAGGIFSDEDVRLLVLVGQSAAMAVATHGLHEKLRAEHATRSNLLRQFSPRRAEQLLSRRGRLRSVGRRSNLALLKARFCDFGISAQEMEPDDAVAMLGRYYGTLAPLIFARHGAVYKFLGDAVLGVFGAPTSDGKHQENALRAALEMRDAVAQLNAELRSRGKPFFECAIGIHCGDAVHGFTGQTERVEFTVIGEVMSLAECYSAAASPSEILISPEMYEYVKRVAEAEPATVPTKDGNSLLGYRAKSIV
jgi:adenylate cyclase